ncbi:LysR family transcriptional regulator [Pseudoflavonifractor phocaeensis]|uniref:LysR family transcriptional regulator n=1 Tax=Pseudoflavonifractor phocaeensis TaxID=1870988 RepID=UPI001959F854|nr:LysR family transcriptional regulator [Pseudoflavonifractor phocaeensis]MBM6926067.1 LysR family transcriptional regulator [Pseudoflavonifractor phocaeensis]
MELRVLRYFLAVAREENISAAAEYLHLTQPTLSCQLMDLEEELGKKLFLRGNRKITLTEDGILFRKRANEILDLVKKTEAEFRSADENIDGDIYIGGGESDAMRLVARTAKILQEKYSGIHYHLHSGNADDVGERLDKGLLDFGILIEPFDKKKYDSLHLPTTDCWGVLMRKDSPLVDRDLIYPEDLLDKPLLCSRQSKIEDGISEWFGRDIEELNIVGTYNLLFNASLMVEEGVAYALCFDKLINTTGNSALCFRPLANQVISGMDLVWKKYQVFSKAAEKFLETLKTQIRAV